MFRRVSEPVVAKVWWEAPHQGMLERFLSASDVVAFGRGAGCAIRIGHAPVYLENVPRVWGELSWHRGRVVVQNVSTRWGLQLVSGSSGGEVSRVEVPPGAAASSPERRFEIIGQAPQAQIRIEVLAAVRGAVDAALLGDDPPSFVPFSLTPTQQLIGAAIVEPLHRGRARRPGYAEVAAASNYSERTVREAVAAMDGLFVLHRLADPDGPSDALDRVAQALRLHSALLGGG
jgi:hypothetical protein